MSYHGRGNVLQHVVLLSQKSINICECERKGVFLWLLLAFLDRKLLLTF
jgi:hypothetical protein